jgi:DNA (cytosine-5)-methyltransferase 1
MKRKTFSVVSLFAGCGGLDLGFRGSFKFLGKNYPRNPFTVTWANDFDANACKSYENYFRHPIVCGDIRELLQQPDIPDLTHPMPTTADVVLGGFPCQDFSHAGKRKGLEGSRGQLYLSMIEVIKRTKPLAFVAENVKGLLTMNQGSVMEIITSDFEQLGYHVNARLLLAADYGVPQMRERVIIVGTRKRSLTKTFINENPGSIQGKLPKFESDDYPKQVFTPETWINLGEALGDLENLSEGQFSNHYWSKARKNKGQGNNLVSQVKPGPTMRTEHHGNIEFHWTGKRRLSAREAARIQSFPDDFEFLPSTSAAYKQIGNAVPPVMAWHIARAISGFLKKHL